MINFSDPFLLLVVLVGLTVLPFVAIMATSFTKIVVVLSLLRNALSIQQVPPGIVLNGLAVVLSIYVMYPVGTAAYEAGLKHFQESGRALSVREVASMVDQAKEPFKEFLKKHSLPKERQFFLESSKVVMGEEVANSLSEDDFIILLPAFVTDEITEAFEVGFLLFLPFLVIDLIVASVLMALGMQMMSPTTISLPFKLLLFVMLEGWSRLLHALVLSYR